MKQGPSKSEVSRTATHALLGTAVGDAFGLKAEGLPRRSVRGLDWRRGPFLGHAVLSDDTEQSFLVGQALLTSDGDVERFRRSLKWRLIGWLFAGPPGVGLGTARSILKLAIGFSAGVRTAGNGAAMRAPVIGATYANNPDLVAQFVRASTALTHRDERAQVGALAVALAAGAHLRGDSVADVISAVQPNAQSAPQAYLWADAMLKLDQHLTAGASVEQYADSIGCGGEVSGFVYHTVPVALFAWARHEDPEEGLREVWSCGGDTDTVGAIAGALLYAKAGRQPSEQWLTPIIDRPLSINRLKACGAALDSGGSAVRWAWWTMPLRNLIAFPLILAYAICVVLPRKHFIR